MRILILFSDLQSDVRFRPNDGFKIARFFFKVVCVCLRIGRQRLTMITRQQFTLESSGEKMKKIQNIEFL